MKFRLIIAASLMASIGSTARADVVTLTDGTKLVGRVEQAVNSDRIVFINGSGRLELPKARIDTVKEESDAQDWTHVGDQFLETGNLTSAVQHYQLALEADSEFGPAKEGLAKAQQGLEAQQQERMKTAQEKVSQEMEEIGIIIGDEDVNEEQLAEAEAQLTSILTSEISNEQRARAQSLLLDVYLKWGFTRYDKMDNKTAEEKYMRALEIDPDNSEARDALLKIWRNNPSKKEEVLKAYQQKLEEEPDNLEYNKQVGELLYESNQWEEAIGPLKKVAASPKYRNQGYDTRLKKSYEGAISDARANGDLERAIAISQDMMKTFPNTDPTSLTVLQYELAKSKLAQDDWDGRAQLVKTLQEIGLTQMASREAELILKSAPENEIALGILRDQAQADLQLIQSYMQAGDYAVARSEAAAFLRKNTRFPELTTQAQEIYNEATIRFEEQVKAQKEQAVAIAERGNQYLYEAETYVQRYLDQDNETNRSPISYRSRAIQSSQRAIAHYEEALRLDPSLGGIDGMDLNNRLNEARSIYNQFTDRPSALPRPRNR